jgi:hypothetical protein
MTILATAVSQAMEAAPWPLDSSFPDVAALLPFALVCLSSIIFMALWLLGVSHYASKHAARR